MMGHAVAMPRKKAAPKKKLVAFLSIALASLALQGCATIQRAPFTEAQQVEAVIPGIPAARFWADAADAGRQMAAPFTGAQGEKTMLALSGGSDNGAYGAGLLNGWTQAGTRPEFSIVTRVSTGALIAPFAFLGSDQNATLERLFTTISAKDIYRNRFVLPVPSSPSAASTKPLVRLIASVVTENLVDRIGREHSRRRRLFVGTAKSRRPAHGHMEHGGDRSEQRAEPLPAFPTSSPGLVFSSRVLPASDDTVRVRRQGHQRNACGWGQVRIWSEAWAAGRLHLAPLRRFNLRTAMVATEWLSTAAASRFFPLPCTGSFRPKVPCLGQLSCHDVSQDNGDNRGK